MLNMLAVLGRIAVALDGFLGEASTAVNTCMLSSFCSRAAKISADY